MCIIISMHYGNICKLCINRIICVIVCVYSCAKVCNIASLWRCPRLQIKDTLIYNAQSTYSTRFLNGETQGRVQDEGKNTLKSSQQAPAIAQEERIDSRGKRMY